MDGCGRDDEAEEHYIKSIEANISHSNVYCVYADFLVYKRKVMRNNYGIWIILLITILRIMILLKNSIKLL